MNKKIISVFAITLIATSILKLTGVNVILIQGYEKSATIVMKGLVPNLLLQTYSAGTRTLVIYMPILFLAVFSLSIYNLIRHHSQSKKNQC